MEVGDRTTDVLLPAVAKHIQFSSIDLQDYPVRPDPMQPDGRILEEVGQFLLAAPEFVLGGFPLDELADIPRHGLHHLQQVSVYVPDALGKEFDHAESPVADDDRRGERAVQPIVHGRGEAGKVPILGDVRYPGCFAATPDPAR